MWSPGPCQVGRTSGDIQYFGSLRRDMWIAGCCPSQSCNEVVPHLGAPATNRLGNDIRVPPSDLAWSRHPGRVLRIEVRLLHQFAHGCEGLWTVLQAVAVGVKVDDGPNG